MTRIAIDPILNNFEVLKSARVRLNTFSFLVCGDLKKLTKNAAAKDITI